MEKEEQRAREGRVLKALYFDNRLPSDPFEPDPLPKTASEAAAPPRAIPQIDLSSNSGDSTVDFSTDGWPSTPAAVQPAAAADVVTPNLKDLLNTLKPSLLQSIMGFKSGTTTTPLPAVSSPPPTTEATADRLAVPMAPAVVTEPHEEPYMNGFDRLLPHGPPPPQHGPPSYHGPPYPGGRGGRMRPDWGPRHPPPFDHRHHRGGPPRPHRLPYGGPPMKRQPCRFWADFGRCAKEDRCTFAHIN